MDINKNIDRMIQRINGSKQNINRQNKEYTNNIRKDYTDNNLKSFITEPKKKIEVIDTCEVLVVGGGPAGLSASIAASRAGCKVILIERYGCFGGVITTVGMETLGWYRYEGTNDCNGLGNEMEKMAQRLGGTQKWPYNDSHCLDADFFKVIADKLIEDNNIIPYLHCYATEVILENNTITGVITESKSGRKAIKAERVIDCTGDADIAYLCGCEYTTLSKKDIMAVTTVFNCSGVDKQTFLNYIENNKKTFSDWGGSWSIDKKEKESKLNTPYISDKSINGTWSSVTDAGEATNLNLIHMKGYDSTSVKDLTKAEIEGRKKTMMAMGKKK